MILRKAFQVGLLVLLVLPGLSMRWSRPFDILSEDDLRLQAEQARPELSSTVDEVPGWDSYNRWLCFDAHEVETLCADACWREDFCVKGGWVKQPIISVLRQGHLYEYEDETRSRELSCEAVLAEWDQLLKQQGAVCIYGAYLQDNEVGPDDNYNRYTGWVLTGLKTGSGYWWVEGDR